MSMYNNDHENKYLVTAPAPAVEPSENERRENASRARRPFEDADKKQPRLEGRHLVS
jgi:hypothetical protein